MHSYQRYMLEAALVVEVYDNENCSNSSVRVDSNLHVDSNP